MGFDVELRGLGGGGGRWRWGGGRSGGSQSRGSISTFVGVGVSVAGGLHGLQVLLLRHSQHRRQDLIVLPVVEAWGGWGGSGGGMKLMGGGKHHKDPKSCPKK